MTYAQAMYHLYFNRFEVRRTSWGPNTFWFLNHGNKLTCHQPHIAGVMASFQPVLPSDDDKSAMDWEVVKEDYL